MKILREFLRYFFLIQMCYSLAGCGKKLSNIKSHKTKEIHTNFTYTPITLDPRKTTDPVSNTLHFMLYEGLTHLETDGSLSFAIADTIEISKDRKTYTFYLRNTIWSDGTPLTAYDFENSWKQLLSPNFPSLASHLLFPIENAEEAKKGLCSLDEVGVNALSSDTLIVKLKQPTPYFMELTAFPTFFPVPNGGKEVERPKNGKIHLIANGPFKLVYWKSEDEVIVQKNVSFWNAKSVKIDAINMTIIPDEATALKLYEKGNLDWLGGLISPLPLDAVTSLSQVKKIKMRPIAGTNFCVFNTKQYPFNNAHIRKAFSYAIDRQLIIDNITQMFDEVATGPVPSILKNYQESHFFSDGNAEKARFHLNQGLIELGIKIEDFPNLTYSYFSSELQKKIALALQSQWRKVFGIGVSLECFELKVFINKLHQRDFQCAQMSWIAQYYDRMSFLERFIKEDSFRNYSSWENSNYQKLIQGSFFIVPPEKRALVLEKAERLLLDEMPIAPIFHYNVLYLKNSHLKNAQISPLGHIDFRFAYIN